MSCSKPCILFCMAPAAATKLPPNGQQIAPRRRTEHFRGVHAPRVACVVSTAERMSKAVLLPIKSCTSWRTEHDYSLYTRCIADRCSLQLNASQPGFGARNRAGATGAADTDPTRRQRHERSISDQKIEAFAVAYLQVDKVRQEYSTKIGATTDEAAKAKLQNEASQEWSRR